jgi:hypothetical protein
MMKTALKLGMLVALGASLALAQNDDDPSCKGLTPHRIDAPTSYVGLTDLELAGKIGPPDYIRANGSTQLDLHFCLGHGRKLIVEVLEAPYAFSSAGAGSKIIGAEVVVDETKGEMRHFYIPDEDNASNRETNETLLLTNEWLAQEAKRDRKRLGPSCVAVRNKQLGSLTSYDLGLMRRCGQIGL